MTNMDFGITGHKRQTWISDAEKIAFLKIKQENPDASAEKRARLLAELCMEDETILYAVVLRVTVLEDYNSTLHNRSPQARAQARTEQQKMQDEAKKRIVAVILMDLVMPNGKRLMSCTGAECIKFGGWLTKVGEQVGPRRLVGDVLDEMELQKLK
jgi:hypothetical protein